MTILTNFWVQKRYQSLADDTWMLFLWGFPDISMLNALEKASKKDHRQLQITEVNSKYWKAHDPESKTEYIVEMRDTKPEHSGVNVSFRDQTIPAGRKQMPKQLTFF